MTRLFDRVMAGLDEALDHARGYDGIVPTSEQIDVSAVRARSGLTETAFAAGLGVDIEMLRDWEQKRRRPEGPARVLLAMIEHDPRIVDEMLKIAGDRA